jgi:hypothetical protein
MKKGLDRAFLEYGIRKPDLEVITELCQKHELNADWVKDNLLSLYHKEKVDCIEMDDSTTESVINRALQILR